MHVSVDTDLCAATGGCTQVAPEVFEIRDDGLVHVLIAEPEAALHEAVLEAADLCPTAAITVNT
jgi:ferredoxin